MIYDALYTILAAATDLTDLVSTRIYPDKAPQGVTAPYVVFQRISGVHLQSHQGSSGLTFPRFQFDAWASQRSAAENIGNEIRLAIQGYSNQSPVSGTVIQAILAENDAGGYDDETQLFRHRSDFFIHHDEEVP